MILEEPEQSPAAAAEKTGQSPSVDDNSTIMEEPEQSPAAAAAEKAGQSPSVDDNSKIMEEPEQSPAAAAEKEGNANLEGEKSSSISSSKTKPSGNDADIFQLRIIIECTELRIKYTHYSWSVKIVKVNMSRLFYPYMYKH
jgi:hypothetical protein